MVAEVTLELADDGRHRVGGEAGPAPGVVAVDRLEQADPGDLEEVVVGLAAPPVAARAALGERQVVDEQLVAQRGGRDRAGTRRSARRPRRRGARGAGLGSRSSSRYPFANCAAAATRAVTRVTPCAASRCQGGRMAQGDTDLTTSPGGRGPVVSPPWTPASRCSPPTTRSTRRPSPAWSRSTGTARSSSPSTRTSPPLARARGRAGPCCRAATPTPTTCSWP